MNDAVIASRTPFAVTVVAGTTYWWCACGRSKTQPFCDGSHKGSAFSPAKMLAEKDQVLWLCGCKQSAAAPLCDGSHKKLAPE